MRALALGSAVALLATAIAHADCAVHFDCPARIATIAGKSFPIVCGSQTGRGIKGGVIGSLIHANGRWRPGLVRPGTSMITTSPQLCGDCFVHVSYVGRGAGSNGCIGTTAAGFHALQVCAGSGFSITPK
jgi:hypothetical protein